MSLLDWSPINRTPRAYGELARCPATGGLLLPITKGYQAIIDECDEGAVTVFRWNAQVTQKWVYARRSTEVGGYKTTITLHRFLMKPPAGMMVDHINQNTLDNRRANLRLATPQQNSVNKRLTGEGPYRGVHRVSGGYRARLNFRRRRIYSPVFASPEAAAEAYDRLNIELNGDFAVTNFPREAAQ
jgi:hypothetical protein